MRNKLWMIVWMGAACIIIACNSSKDDPRKPIAKFNENILYIDDLQGVMPKGVNKQDSIDFVKKYTESWIRQQLFLNNARKKAEIDEKDLQKRVDEYHNTLITYEFEKQYLEKNLKSEISESEIEEYYKTHSKEFELRQNIIKGYFVKLPGDSPEEQNFKKIMLESQVGNSDNLQKYSAEKAISYAIADTSWVDFEELIVRTPLENIGNKVNFLKNNRFYQTRDSTFTYLLKVNEYKIVNQEPPIEFVKDRIKNMILNQRKVQLLKDLEEALFEEGRSKKSFEIYP